MGRRRSKKLTNEEATEAEKPLPVLPQHIIIEILSRVPQNLLSQKFRYICKPWYRLISSREFLERNASLCEPAVLVQTGSRWSRKWSHKTSLMEMDHTCLDFKLYKFGPTRMGMIRSSFDGLILVDDYLERKLLHVKNVFTGSTVTLPVCPSHCPHRHNCGAALGFCPQTGEYKVVHMYSDGLGFEVFTLGCRSDNAWEIKSLPFAGPHEQPFNDSKFAWHDPVSINGQVFHWYADSDEYIISVDISDLGVRKTYLPNLGTLIRKEDYSLLEVGGKLALLYRSSKDTIDIWVLQDFDRTIWSKEHIILAGSTKFNPAPRSGSQGKYKLVPEGSEAAEEKKEEKLPDFMKLVPGVSLRNGEVIIFKHVTRGRDCDHRLYLYDLKLGEMWKLKLKLKMTMNDTTKMLTHRSSCRSVEDLL